MAWRNLIGIAILQAAIGLGWLAYGICQPQILVHYQETALAAPLAVLQGLLGAVLEPLLGDISDERLQRAGSRFVVIAAGVTVTGLLFLAVATTLRLPVLSASPWLLLALMLCWVAAMSTFRSPSLALIRGAASVRQLPQAAAVLALVTGMVGASGPLVRALVERLGAPLTFAAGGVVLGLSALPLYRLARSAPGGGEVPVEAMPSPPARGRRVALASVMAIGVGAGGVVIGFLRVIPAALVARHPGLPEVVAASLVLFAAAWLSLMLGKPVEWLGARRLEPLALGLVLAAVLLGQMRGGAADAAAVLGAIGLGLAQTCAIPLAIEAAPEQAGLVIGLYFGGFSLAAGLSALCPTPFVLMQAVAGLCSGLMGLVGLSRAYADPRGQTSEAHDSTRRLP